VRCTSAAHVRLGGRPAPAGARAPPTGSPAWFAAACGSAWARIPRHEA